MTPSAPILIISPCRDEERTLSRTIACLCAQTVKQRLWIVVDDGSTDRTPEILAEAQQQIPWLKVVRREDRGKRALGGGVIDAFYDGLAAVPKELDYDFVAKMDVDLEVPARYIERLLELFDAEPSLAAASGKVFRREGEGLVEEFMIDEMVAGQFKFYRREAFAKIGGFVREVMWDGIDFHRARMAGYTTRSVHDPDLQILHLRLMGSSDHGVYKGRIRWGGGQWFMGSSLSYVLASGLYRMREKPYGIGGLLIVVGYLLAAAQGKPRYDDPDFRENLRQWQAQRITQVFTEARVR